MSIESERGQKIKVDWETNEVITSEDIDFLIAHIDGLDRVRNVIDSESTYQTRLDTLYYGY